MNYKMIESIFNNCRFDFVETKEIEKNMTKELNELIGSFDKDLSAESRDYLLEAVFSSSLISERQGFILGFQYAFYLFTNFVVK
ncbi:hypothetical protein LJC58_01050 [Lachnospiraceae bacterium OttesenSCG-928-D06]|nr:hypothetical protein [Lachnospiraceae bacterium OttesenSCG-928-D06]